MPNPTIRIHNSQTGEVIDRLMTKEEYADYQAESAALEADKNAQASAKATKVAAYEKLGLTASEIESIVG